MTFLLLGHCIYLYFVSVSSAPNSCPDFDGDGSFITDTDMFYFAGHLYAIGPSKMTKANAQAYCKDLARFPPGTDLPVMDTVQASIASQILRGD